MLHLDVTVTVKGFSELGVFLDCEPDMQPSTLIPAKANEVRSPWSLQRFRVSVWLLALALTVAPCALVECCAFSGGCRQIRSQVTIRFHRKHCCHRPHGCRFCFECAARTSVRHHCCQTTGCRRCDGRMLTYFSGYACFRVRVCQCRCFVDIGVAFGLVW